LHPQSSVPGRQSAVHIVPGFIVPALATATQAVGWHTATGAQSTSAAQASSEKTGATTPQRARSAAPVPEALVALAVADALADAIAEVGALGADDAAKDELGTAVGPTGARRAGQATSARASASSGEGKREGRITDR
jgi:hypothetical protein